MAEEHRNEKAVRDLKRLAGEAANTEVDLIAAVRAIIALAIDGEADPYIVAGLLLEGAVLSIKTLVPEQRQPEVGAAMLQLLIDRMRSHHVFPPATP